MQAFFSKNFNFFFLTNNSFWTLKKQWNTHTSSFGAQKWKKNLLLRAFCANPLSLTSWMSTFNEKHRSQWAWLGNVCNSKPSLFLAVLNLQNLIDHLMNCHQELFANLILFLRLFFVFLCHSVRPSRLEKMLCWQQQTNVL